MKIDLLDALRNYGTAGGPKRPVIVEKQLYFKGFEPFSVGLWDSTCPSKAVISGIPACSAGKHVFRERL
jgi:hypothetical protein